MKPSISTEWQEKWTERHPDALNSDFPWTVGNLPGMMFAGPADAVGSMMIDWINEYVLEEAGVRADVTFVRTGAHTAKSPRRSI